MRGGHLFTLCLVAVCCLWTITSALERPEACGDTIGCYHDCDDCSFVVTWKDTGDVVEFSLHLALDGSSDQWMALGLSDDTDMGSDSVTDCIQDSGDILIAKSYNVDGQTNNLPLTNTSIGIQETGKFVSDGVLTCTYTQTKVNSHDQVFNLNTDWYLLVAMGAAAGGNKKVHSLSELPAVSPVKADLQSTDDISGTAVNVLIKIHGCLMLFAWVFCASIGIVLARYYKPMWPQRKLLTTAVWFTFHRICMVLALVACVVGFVLIFVEVQEWSKLTGNSNFKRAHPYLGVIVTALCLLNPIMAMFRPAPDAEKRFLFNWAHWFVGTSAYILSALTLILGVTLAKASVPFYMVYVLVGWVVYQMLFHLVLEMYDCCIIGTNNSVSAGDGDGLKAPAGSALKKVAINLHVCIITAFTVFSIVIVAIN